jgi:hypothetical protein
MTTMVRPVRDDQFSRITTAHLYLIYKQDSISETSEPWRSLIGIQYRLTTFEVQSIAISRTPKGLVGRGVRMASQDRKQEPRDPTAEGTGGSCRGSLHSFADMHLHRVDLRGVS